MEHFDSEPRAFSCQPVLFLDAVCVAFAASQWIYIVVYG